MSHCRTGVIGVEPLSGRERHAAERHLHVNFAHAQLRAPLRIGAECLHAEINRGEGDRVAHGTMNNHAAPAVRGAERGELIAEQRGTEETTAVNDQDLAGCGRFEGATHEGVVGVAAERADFSGEGPLTAERPKLQAARLAALAVSVAQVSRRERSGYGA